MRRDKKLARKKKARADARRDSRNATAAKSNVAILRAARTAEFGPAYLSPQWRDESLPPALVSAIITRTLPGGIIVPYLVLVDRTCLGVKDAFANDPMPASDLASFVEDVGAIHDGGMEAVDVATAQSVIFHALDYAASLGFRPHRDFDEAMVGPRPGALEATPHARPERPFYMPGPNDDVARITGMLRVAVGPDGFDLPDFDEVMDELRDMMAEPEGDDLDEDDDLDAGGKDALAR